MIVQYYRSNQPVLLMTVPVVGIVFWAIHFADYSGSVPIDGEIFRLLPSFEIPVWVSKILAMLFICVQAVQVNRLISNSEVFSKSTHIPMLFLIMMATMLSHQGMLHAAIISNTFILLALRDTLTVYHQNSAAGITFNIGFWIGLATLFIPTYFLTLFAAMIAILILRAASWRELFFLFIGALMPFGFMLTICFLNDVHYTFPENIFHFQKYELPYQDSGLFLSVLGLMGLLILFASGYYISSLQGTILRIRKMRLAILYFLLVLCGVYVFILFTGGEIIYNEILLLPVTFMLSYLYAQTSRPILTGTWIYLILGLWLIFVYNLYMN